MNPRQDPILDVAHQTLTEIPGDRWFRRVAVFATSVAAVLFGSVFFFGLFGVLSHGSTNILNDRNPAGALLGFGTLTALTSYMAWRFLNGNLSANGKTMLPPWLLWTIGLMVTAGFVFEHADEYRHNPREVVLELVVGVVCVVLALILRRVHMERLISYLFFAFWIGGDYYLHGTIAWLPVAFLTIAVGLIVWDWVDRCREVVDSAHKKT